MAMVMYRLRPPTVRPGGEGHGAGKGYRVKLIAATDRNRPYMVPQRERGVGSLNESFDAALVSGACFKSLDNLRGKVEVAAI
jgi:hypothetical protein